MQGSLGWRLKAGGAQQVEVVVVCVMNPELDAEGAEDFPGAAGKTQALKRIAIMVFESEKAVAG